MKKLRIIAVCIIVLSVIFICSGCAIDMQDFENAETRQLSEAMLNALIANDFQTAYSLVKNICSESDFAVIFEQMQEIIGNTDAYELKLLSIHTSSTITNKGNSKRVQSVYEMTGGSHIIVNVAVDEQLGIINFFLSPYEKTDYYSTGTIQNMNDATPLQWLFILLNVIPLAVTVLAIIDCLRKNIKKKALWMLLLIFGFFTISITLSASAFKANFNFGWFSAYSALIHYGSGTLAIRFMLPLGAIIYFLSRRNLLQKSIAKPELTEDNIEQHNISI